MRNKKKKRRKKSKTDSVVVAAPLMNSFQSGGIAAYKDQDSFNLAKVLRNGNNSSDELLVLEMKQCDDDKNFYRVVLGKGVLLNVDKCVYVDVEYQISRS